MRPFHSSRGSVTLEAAGSSLTLALCASSLVTLCYLAFCQMWTDKALYEFLICNAEGKAGWVCHKEAQKLLSVLPRPSQPYQLRVRQVGDSWQGSLHWPLTRGHSLVQRQVFHPLAQRGMFW